MFSSLFLLVLAACSIPFSSVLADSHGEGFPPFGAYDPPPPPPATTGPMTDLASTPHYFDQLIDHYNPSLGTFKQMYFFSDQYWTRQGAPIVLMNPGEQSAGGFAFELTSPASIQRALMMSLGAAGVVMEHRYWGQSSPYQTLSTANLRYLNVDQAIEDARYFIENVKLPWTKAATSSHPDVVPWINLGCSYSGLLTAYTQKKYPDKFAAAWASSAPVQAQGDFWQYFEPIEEGMPKNCSKDLAAAIKKIDQTLLSGFVLKERLKRAFGLYNLKDDDFGRTLSRPLWSWQGMQASSYATSKEDPFYQFCDAIETHPDGTIEKTANGVGMPTALNNFAKYIKTYVASGCGAPGGGCYTTYDYTSNMYTDWSVSKGPGRQWFWMVCNEFGWFQGGDPGNYSSIVSSLVTPGSNLRQCNHMYPHADGSPGNYHPNTFWNNFEHGGWNLRARNLFVVNGQFDPWRSASISSRWAPKFHNTPHQRVEVVKGGHHCWDWNLYGAYYDHDVKRVVDRGIKRVRSWVRQWYRKHRNVENSMPKGKVDIWAGIL
ncbi:hypothetical protein FRC04_003525 [Tulasnella sp. 424]|nr:hypothetical protein FRC04_003525 [Tulasnella sp. 424]KAG8960673.1 hypothetical protein FRC05_006695 [Tulasnella sp. 425]